MESENKQLEAFNTSNLDITRDRPDWVGPKKWNKRLLDFFHAKTELGLNNREAAIHSGVSEASAYTEGSRMSKYTLIKEEFDNYFADHSEDHRNTLNLAIMNLKSFMRDTTLTEKTRLAAASKLVDLYKDTIVMDLLLEHIEPPKTIHATNTSTSDEGNPMDKSVAVFNALVGVIGSPTQTRTLEDVNTNGSDSK